jgi:hypothetical protein
MTNQRAGLLIAALVGVIGALPVASSARAQTTASSIPAPAQVLGFEPGADYRLAHHEQIVNYFRRLAQASDRIVVREIGRSVQGRPLLLAIVSDPANLRALEAHRATSEALARGRLDDAAAARRVAEGRAVVWIDAGLHATEVATAQHMPLLVHHLVTDESPETQRIRREVITLLMPVMNPDGLDMVAAWYHGNVGTPFEVAPLPWLYHVYAGHDNNRDWFMITQPETRAVARVLYEEWYPQIVYNHHQIAPSPARIFVPPFVEPVNPNIPAGVVAGVNLVGAAMAQRFADEGKSGVVSRVQFDMWWNGGMRTAPYFHNMIGILTETALHRYATPRYYPLDSLPEQIGRTRVPALEPTVFHPDPWRGGWWRIRDAVDYMMTASLAVLALAADRREQWLAGMHRMAREAVELGGTTAPFAYLVPPEQHDPWAARELVDVLRRGGVEVSRATEPFQAAGRGYPAGTYVLTAAQAFRPYLIDLLEAQLYPNRVTETGAPERPYDLSGWTLPLQMGVRVDRVDEPFSALADPILRPSVPVGSVRGAGRAGFLLEPGHGAAALAINRLLAAGERVSRLTANTRIDGVERPPGTFLVHDARSTRERIAQLAAELGLEFHGTDATPAGLRQQRQPRIGVYRSWVASMDEGWTRFVLEQNGFPYDTIRDADLRRGDLARYDVIILPHQAPAALRDGHRHGEVPPAYAGGPGAPGVSALNRYVRAGGQLVALDGAAQFAITQLGLPVRNVVDDVSSGSFAIPGSLLRVHVDVSDPLGWGMQREAAAHFVSGRAFEVVLREAQTTPFSVPVRFAERDVLLSGWELGAADHIGGHAAVLRVAHGAGQVVLFGIRPQFRAQPHGTFKLLFNALYAAAAAPASSPSPATGMDVRRVLEHLAVRGAGE